jgi:hypothetical protein
LQERGVGLACGVGVGVVGVGVGVVGVGVGVVGVGVGVVGVGVGVVGVGVVGVVVGTGVGSTVPLEPELLPVFTHGFGTSVLLAFVTVGLLNAG